MKRLIPACILAILLTVICIVAYAVTRSSCDDTERMLDFCESAFTSGEVDAARTAADDFGNHWRRTKRVLAVFTGHYLLDNVSYSAARMSGFAQSGQDGAALAECAQIREYLIQLLEEQGIESAY